MNKRLIGIYILALLSSICLIYGVALEQEPVIQSDIIEKENVEEKQKDIVEDVIEIEEQEGNDDFQQYYKEYQVPSNRGLKTYMSYKAITSKNSLQYNLQKHYAYTGEFGIRQIDGRFCVAIGTFSDAKIGTYIDLVLENGVTISCVVSDFKSDTHTDSTNITTLHNGCVSEFVVDMSKLYKLPKKMGDISYCKAEWNSPVKIIKVYEKNVFDGEE